MTALLEYIDLFIKQSEKATHYYARSLPIMPALFLMLWHTYYA